MDQRNSLAKGDVIAACVRALVDLEQEVRAASSAIACNNLSGLEESLWHQETLCSRLKPSMSPLREILSDTASIESLREAASSLKTQTQAYEKLVIQSSRSVAILQQLCALYRNAAQQPWRAIDRSISREA